MRRVEFVPFALGGEVDIFSIRIDGDSYSEMEKFVHAYKNCNDFYLRDDYYRIFQNLSKILHTGVVESMFRPEGNMGDRVCALPLLTIRRDVKKRGTLRLYCIRLSEKLLIVGAGGKKCTTTYEQDPVLLEIVETLKSIDKKLVTLEKSGIDIHSEIYNLTVRIN